MPTINRRRFPFTIGIGIGLCFASLSHVTSAQPASPSGRSELIDLPLETAETTGEIELIARQRMQWNRTTGIVSWDRLEVETPDDLHLRMEPASYDPDAETEQAFGFTLDVRDGSIAGQAVLRPDGSWAAPLTVELAPRSARWEDPSIVIDAIAMNTDLAVDSRLAESSVPYLEELVVRMLRARTIQAGIYDIRDLSAEGAWRRPEWKVDSLRAQAFGGEIFLTGEGLWGTDVPIRVSLTIEVDGVDVQQMLRAFNIPRADQIEGRIRGNMSLRADGRSWEVLEMDVEGVEGTVYLHRDLLYDMLGSWLGILTEEQMRETLNSAFGDREMIPFDRLSLGGSLMPDTLNMRIPLENEVMDIFIEPRVDRELLWDIYDQLVEAGVENLQSVELDSSTAD